MELVNFTEEEKINSSTPYSMYFEDSGEESWDPVDDRVMGGMSQSVFLEEDEYATFRGKVRKENFGGFCSIHGPMMNLNLEEYSKFRLTVRGDDIGYRFLAYTSDRKGSYRADLPVSEEWSEVDIPFSKIYPYKWGWWMPLANSFDPSNFQTLGFQTEYKSTGEFELNIKKIEVL